MAVAGAKSAMPTLLRRGIKSAMEHYERANANHPVVVRGGIGIGLFAFGDYIAQRLDHAALTDSNEHSRPRGMLADEFYWDPARAFRSSSWRAIVWAPIATGFWHFLDRRVRISGARGAMVKIAADLASLNLLMTYTFIAWSKTWTHVQLDEPVSAREVIEYTNERFPKTILRSYAYWFPLHCVTYGLVPARHRLVWVSICSIGFAALLSCSASDSGSTDAKDKEPVAVAERQRSVVPSQLEPLPPSMTSLVSRPFMLPVAAPPPPGPPTAPPPLMLKNSVVTVKPLVR